METATLGEALNLARSEIVANWQTFRADFLRNQR
jgi:hypothetical protein